MPDVGKECLTNAGGGFFADRADIVVDTATLTEEDWHKYRKMGIGGSDVAAILGVSPWTTPYSLYLTKSGKQTLKEEKVDDGQAFIFEYGHAMEPIVANTFERITGLEVLIDTCMYRHKDYPFMQANIDRVVRMPDGTLALLECKTTTSFNKDAWADDKVPRYYKLQCQHYMAILNVDVCYIACIYGNTLNDFVCRRIDRNLDEEKELIAAECDFWNNYVVNDIAPPFTLNGELESKAALKMLPYADKKKEKMQLPNTLSANMQQWVNMYNQKKELEKTLEGLENQMKLIAIPIQETMQDTTKGYCDDGTNVFHVDFSPRGKTKINKEKLKQIYPDIYREVCTEETEAYRVFSVKAHAK